MQVGASDKGLLSIKTWSKTVSTLSTRLKTRTRSWADFGHLAAAPRRAFGNFGSHLASHISQSASNINKLTPNDIAYGAVGLATWFGSKEFILRKAGEAQIAAGTSRPEWQPRGASSTGTDDQGRPYSVPGPLLPPYGDDPEDQKMIRRGFDYYNSTKH